MTVLGALRWASIRNARSNRRLGVLQPREVDEDHATRSVRLLAPLAQDLAERRLACLSVVNHHSRREYRRIMRDLAERGAEVILLGCTDIDLLVGPDDAPLPVFETTRPNAEKTVDALEPIRAL